MSSPSPIRILFVCLGNICRSPLVEAIARQYIQSQAWEERFHLASAGTGNWHIGRGADPRSAETAQAHGLDLSTHRAQQITLHNMDAWDWFIAMDDENHLNLLAMGVPPSRLLMMRQFEHQQPHAASVPDPYYGGEQGFEQVYHMLVANTPKIFAHIQHHN